MDGQPIIEGIGLTKMYGSFAAISNVNLSVERGEFMGLLGPNGSGKSTTLKAITGLLRPTSGTVRIDGVDISNHRVAMNHVGCVIETPEPYPEFTPTEILQYVGRLYGLDKEETRIRARDVLESVKMWDWRAKPIGGFSKGMRQRVIIAQALLANPNTIILDEPTSGLDPRGMIEVREVLSALRERGRSLLISTHILKEVSEICGSVTMIRDGSVVVSGNVNDLVHGLNKGDVTLEITTLRPFDSPFVQDVGGLQGVMNCEAINKHVLRLSFNGTNEQQAEVNDFMFNSGLGIMSINEEGADLESLYMELTKGGDMQ